MWEASPTPISLKHRERLKWRHRIEVGDPSHKSPQFKKVIGPGASIVALRRRGNFNTLNDSHFCLTSTAAPNFSRDVFNIMSDLAARVAGLSPAQRKLLEQRLKNQPSQPAAAGPIAIIGMACRFPGAPDLRSFWRLIREGRSAAIEVPPDRWNADAFFDPTGETPGKMSVRRAAFIENVDQFDPQFFGITPREAVRMDPQQRLLLEVAWEAMENAGQPADEMAGTCTGVFVGIGGNDYSKVCIGQDDYYQRIDAHMGTGNALSIAANRVSYVFDFHGPSAAIDTACSSSSLAIHFAVDSLRRGESDAALAGGAESHPHAGDHDCVLESADALTRGRVSPI